MLLRYRRSSKNLEAARRKVFTCCIHAVSRFFLFKIKREIEKAKYWAIIFYPNLFILVYTLLKCFVSVRGCHLTSSLTWKSPALRAKNHLHKFQQYMEKCAQRTQAHAAQAFSPPPWCARLCGLPNSSALGSPKGPSGSSPRPIRIRSSKGDIKMQLCKWNCSTMLCTEQGSKSIS